MTERSVFLAALEYDDPAERSAYLDRACAGEPALRAEVERLLTAHEQAGSFMGRPAPERLAEDLAAGPETDDPRTTPAAAGGDEGLDFLEPSGSPKSLGRLGHYEVQEVVGRGGMGVVLRAFDEQLHRVVAIKVMAAQLATSATARQRFTREARAAAAVTHDQVVTIHAVEDAGPLPYIVMQFVAGTSLQDRLDRMGPLQLHEVLRIGMQTASGLAAAHAQGLVHRDVKPANILLENGVERVKLTDFGLARAAADASLTQSGTVAGTPSFMSPEQAEGKPIDPRSDLFSLGSVLYAMCTGRLPFRAGSSMGVLKRVCEDTPTPIGETNPEVPDWLVAVVEKLHAKDPAARFQSAAEVAELLGQHLAHVQHPSVVPQPLVAKPADGPPALARPARRKRWAVAAAVLAAVVAALGTAEATGVTNIRATVIRIFTPDGTLVVEVDEPGVKVTIEGDGGLVITGAGLEEIRLRPGSYRIQADKDGKRVPLERELVSIAKGGREVVKVKLEAPPVPVVAKTEMGAFVRLGGKGAAERKFDTLAEAVQSASDGDTIEIRGNGPFVSQPIKITRALTIRAAAGSRPVIQLSPEATMARADLLETKAPLTLEGLDLEVVPEVLDIHESRYSSIVKAGTPLYIANCRLLLLAKQPRGAPVISYGPICELRNCEIIGPRVYAIGAYYTPRLRVSLDNCCGCLGTGMKVNYFQGGGTDYTQESTIRLTRNTFVASEQFIIFQVYPDKVNLWNKDLPTTPMRCEIEGNILDARLAVALFSQAPPGKILPRGEAEAALPQVFTWHGARNLYAIGGPFLRLMFPNEFAVPVNPIRSVEEWGKYWGTGEAGSIEGRVRYQSGDLLARLAVAPEKLTAEDFRLRADSAGYHAGKDGKDLGADVDLVGPGPAYERWKQTPEYQQWQKDTGQIKAEAPKPEAKAFALMGGKGVAERKFDTLAEAVLNASDGDTIEVRGNGPFVSQPIAIRNRALTIRAGDGFRPVIKGDPDEQGNDLLSTKAPLVLEGLDFQWVGAKAFDPTGPSNFRLVVSNGPGSRLYVANCRFLMNRREGPNDGMNLITASDTAHCRLRNCQFLYGGHGRLGGSFLAFRGILHSELMVDNCLIVGHGMGLQLTHAEPMKAVLRRNTFLGSSSPIVSFILGKKIDPPLGEKDPRSLQMEISANILDGYVLFSRFGDYLAKGKVISAKEAEQLLTQLIGWRENRNLYLLPEERDLLRLSVETTPGRYTRLPLTAPLKTLAEWQRFWGLADIDSERGQAKFQGGDLGAKAKFTPELLAPDDFRLRPDSAGYRAGKDGKDLGADVDLVGPGPAYERWKKTPEYQQWLKDTGQVK